MTELLHVEGLRINMERSYLVQFITAAWKALLFWVREMYGWGKGSLTGSVC